MNIDDILSDLSKEIKKIEKSINSDIEKSIEKELRRFSKIAENYFKLTLKEYMSSYTPVVYQRTGKTMQGIKLNTKLIKGVNSISMEVEFLDSYMNRTEKITGAKRHTYMALNNGWSIRSGNRKPSYRFSYYEGYHQLERAERMIRDILPEWITLDIKWRGES